MSLQSLDDGYRHCLLLLDDVLLRVCLQDQDRLLGVIWLQQGGLARQGGEQAGCGGVPDALDTK